VAQNALRKSLHSGSTAWFKLRASIRRANQIAFDLLYPEVCASCGDDIALRNESSTAIAICGDCIGELVLFGDSGCPRCGAPAPDGMQPTAQGCSHCRGRRLWFDSAVALGEYTGRLREMVLAMKPSSGDRLSLVMGELLWSRFGKRFETARIDVVAPIPMHWRRRLVHRTNSAAILGESLAARMACPFAEHLLRRQRHTPPQFSRTPAQRWENLRHAFSVRRGYHFDGAHVLLVDDILTSGATCSEAAKVLKRAGAERVTVAVVARALVH